ncbi:hypothetical protein BD779DRAFT_1478903 [Infundibulicybe gibba]|nr:hypothetical protein BD779DRAFT_1478903 [Infundibulicybe gibba]
MSGQPKHRPKLATSRISRVQEKRIDAVLLRGISAQPALLCCFQVFTAAVWAASPASSAELRTQRRSPLWSKRLVENFSLESTIKYVRSELVGARTCIEVLLGLRDSIIDFSAFYLAPPLKNLPLFFRKPLDVRERRSVQANTLHIPMIPAHRHLRTYISDRTSSQVHFHSILFVAVGLGFVWHKGIEMTLGLGATHLWDRAGSMRQFGAGSCEMMRLPIPRIVGVTET